MADDHACVDIIGKVNLPTVFDGPSNIIVYLGKEKEKYYFCEFNNGCQCINNQENFWNKFIQNPLKSAEMNTYMQNDGMNLRKLVYFIGLHKSVISLNDDTREYLNKEITNLNNIETNRTPVESLEEADMDDDDIDDDDDDIDDESTFYFISKADLNLLERFRKASGLEKIGLRGYKYLKQYLTKQVNYIIPFATVLGALGLQQSSNIKLIPVDELSNSRYEQQFIRVYAKDWMKIELTNKKHCSKIYPIECSKLVKLPKDVEEKSTFERRELRFDTED